MPFGKYKGRAFPNIPSQYLKWLLELEYISQEIKDEAMTVIMQREKFIEFIQLDKNI